MKNIFCAVILSLFVLSNLSCLKNNNNSCTPKTAQSQQSDILAFASANGISATAHISGLYYQIINPGSGVTPSASSKIFVKYTGKLLNGTVFDSRSDASQTGWILGNQIAGWQIGLSLIQKGGSIKLIIPSALAYGCQAVGIVPPDSILYFEVELVDVM